MPRPIPPPPPQASPEETVLAIRSARWLALVALGLFGLLSLQYSVGGWGVAYGRSNGASWNLWKLDQLDVRALRGEENHRIAWLVGSSILRESFDEPAINKALQARDSHWRVAKFGQTRGAAGLSWGLARRLPLEPGDRIIHSVAVENYRRDWLNFTDLPGWRIQLMQDPHEVLEISEWSWQQRLEEWVAFPHNFYRFHEEHMAGVTAWLLSPLEGRPHKKKRSYHIRHRTWTESSSLHSARAKGEASRYFLSLDDIDMSEQQFNVVGLERIEALCNEKDVALTLIDIPPRREYQESFLTPEVRSVWDDWRTAQADLTQFPQIPEDAYYDMKHPNHVGREILSNYLVGWLVQGADDVEGRVRPLHTSQPARELSNEETP